MMMIVCIKYLNCILLALDAYCLLEVYAYLKSFALSHDLKCELEPTLDWIKEQSKRTKKVKTSMNDEKRIETRTLSK